MSAVVGYLKQREGHAGRKWNNTRNNGTAGTRREGIF
jgi:hypothetical protein